MAWRSGPAGPAHILLDNSTHSLGLANFDEALTDLFTVSG
jgi:hypothetical protein